MNITTNAAGVTTATQEFAGAMAKAVALPGRDRIRLHAGWESQSDRDMPAIGHVTHNQAIALIDALKAVLDATSKGATA